MFNVHGIKGCATVEASRMTLQAAMDLALEYTQAGYAVTVASQA